MPQLVDNMSEDSLQDLQSKVAELEKRCANNTDFWSSIHFFLDNSSDIQCILDKTTRELVACNRITLSTLGYSFDELVEMGFENLLKQEEKSLFNMAIDYANNNENSEFPIEGHLNIKHSSPIFVEISVKQVRDGSCDKLYYIVSVKNLKRVKQRLELFENIINSFPIMLWYKDTNDKIFKVNKAASDFEQVAPSDLVGKTSHELYPRDYADTVYAEDQDIISLGKPKVGHIKKHVTVGHQESRWIQVCKSPLVNNDGRTTGLLTFACDVTAQKQAQEQLRQSEERFKKITETVTDYIYTVWVEGNIAVRTSHGPACISVTGYSSEEFEADQNLWLNMVIQEDKLEVLEKTIQILQGQQVQTFEHRIQKKDGSIRYVTNTPVLHKGENGVLYSYDGLIRDITEIKKKEKEIKERQNLLSSIFKLAPVGIGIIGDKIINKVNHHVCEMLGYTEDELVGQPAMVLFPSLEEFEFVFREQAWVISNNGSLTLETLWRKKNGDVIDILYNSTPISAGDLNQGLMFTAQDITKRKKDEEMLKRSELEMRQQNDRIKEINAELMSAKNKAEESDKLKSAFLANMSHEIRTPMNAILGFSEFLRDPNIEREEFEEYLDIINTSGEQLLNIINDIIDISRIEAGQEKVIERPVNIDLLLGDIQGLFKAQALKQGIEILFDKNAYDASGLTILSDHTKFKQIVTNLVGNSLKFTKKGHVRFGYEVKDGYIEFYVNDTGIGISKENQGPVFERFRQAEIGLTKKEGGTGLGLSISKALVELLGGKIWLESELNVGSTFYFTLPLKVAPKVELEEKNIFDKNFNWQSIHILVAEDDDINYYYLQKALESTKIKLSRAKNGVMCVNLFKQDPSIRLILMDIKMPEMDGYQATKLIKEVNPDMIIIAQTAFALANEREKALKAGLNDYITKPIDKDKLLAMMEKHLTRKSDSHDI